MTKVARHGTAAAVAGAAPAAAPAALSTPPTGLARYLKLEKLGEGNYGAVYKVGTAQRTQRDC
jgi:hypothetical protein